jgi:hypothetical protein
VKGHAPPTCPLSTLSASGDLGGADRELGTSSRLLRFVMRMLATGSNCLPAAGIGAVSEQLASRLPPDVVRLNARVCQARVQQMGSRNQHCRDLPILGKSMGETWLQELTSLSTQWQDVYVTFPSLA